MLKKIESVKTFAENEKMELNAKKCKEMIIDFRKDGTVIPAIKINLMTLSLKELALINYSVYG